MTEKLREKFNEYHQANPHLYEAFEKYAKIAASHRSHFAAITIINRIRWDTMLKGNDEYKINNNYAAYYGRLFEEKNPEHEGLFRKRTV